MYIIAVANLTLVSVVPVPVSAASLSVPGRSPAPMTVIHAITDSTSTDTHSRSSGTNNTTGGAGRSERSHRTGEGSRNLKIDTTAAPTRSTSSDAHADSSTACTPSFSSLPADPATTSTVSTTASQVALPSSVAATAALVEALTPASDCSDDLLLREATRSSDLAEEEESGMYGSDGVHPDYSAPSPLHPHPSFPGSGAYTSAYSSPFHSAQVSPQGQQHASFFSEMYHNNTATNRVIDPGSANIAAHNYSIASLNVVSGSGSVGESECSSDRGVRLGSDSSAGSVGPTDSSGSISIASPTGAGSVRVVSPPGLQVGLRNNSYYSGSSVGNGTGDDITSASVGGSSTDETVIHTTSTGDFIGTSNHTIATNSAARSTDVGTASGVSTRVVVQDTFTVPSLPVTLTPRTTTPTTNSASTADASTAPSPLPVDAHRDVILQHVRTHRVTVINGMTGCGKSTRIPVMLWEDAGSDRGGGQSEMEGEGSVENPACTDTTTTSADSDAGDIKTTTPPASAATTTTTSRSEAYIMVSQPRRIAATALKNRLHFLYGEVVGLRLGRGMREETTRTRIWFVTTGYLVRLLAHKMHSLGHLTHLVIDEIHERSLDCDILCYLARRLLHTFPHMRLVLMSATAHSSMFSAYFSSASSAIFVGVRRFPLQEHSAGDLFPLLPQTAHRTLTRLVDATNVIASSNNNNNDVYSVVQDSIVRDQLHIAHLLSRAVGRVGGAVLIFVSGMSDITELMDLFNSHERDRQSKKGTCDDVFTKCFVYCYRK